MRVPAPDVYFAGMLPPAEFPRAIVHGSPFDRVIAFVKRFLPSRIL